jgi:Tol biopolymer transport system component
VSENIEQLLREGIAAARTGDKPTAKQKLQQVVGLDPQNEKGWYWLASVVDTDEEKRVCLGNVVVINPGNTRAKALLESLEKSTTGQDEGEGASGGGINRRVLIGGGIAAVVVVLLLFIVVFRGGGSSDTPPSPTVQAAQPTTAPITKVALQADVTPPTVAPTLPNARSTLPPTWTPVPTKPGAGGTPATPLPTPPAGIPGRLIIESGSDLGNNTFPIFIMPMNTGKLSPVVPEDRRGDYAYLTPSGQYMIYTRYYQGADAFQVDITTLDGGDYRDASILWGNTPPVGQQDMSALSRDGHMLVFVGRLYTENDGNANLYAVPFNYTGKNTQAASVVRVTAKDTGDNSWPTLAPDGSRIVYVHKGTLPNGTGTDLFVTSLGGGAPPPPPPTSAKSVGGAGETYPPVPMMGGQPASLTNDGDTWIEAAPEFSPDGSQIAYQAYQGSAAGSGSPDTQVNSIFIMPSSGGSAGVVVQGGNNIRPHWSPDGHYIAFSSNRSGKWQVYIVEVGTGVVYQMTNSTTAITICSGWSN